MIVGIGIDCVDVQRFVHWHTYSPRVLRRIFCQEEIDYCLQNKIKSAERFAVRFAAREALFKALTMYAPHHTIPFLTLCSLSSVQKNNAGVPILYIDWKVLTHTYLIKPATPLLSLTHTQQIATAWVILQKNIL
jgi:holo-[acyl-carrier protein] synthase